MLVVVVLCGAMSLSGCIFLQEGRAVVLVAAIFMDQAFVNPVRNRFSMP
jgi:hypothetical protein